MKIGIDLGGSHIAIGVVDNNGKIVEKSEKRLKSAEKKNIEKTVEEYVIESAKYMMQKYKITNMGFAVPGTVTKDTIVKSVNLGIKNYELLKNLSENINIPITMRNDAKCAGLAENTYGCLKTYKRSLFLTLGTGIGGAVIIDGKLLNSGDLPGSEIGHMVVEKDGIKCACGRKGCWEKYASMKCLKDAFRSTLGYDEKVSGKELLAIIKAMPKEDEKYDAVQQILKNHIEYLALGIANLVNVFEPEAIGIGGSFVYFSELLLSDLKKELLQKNMLFNSRKDIIIQTAVLGNDAGIIGAVL